MKPAKKLFYSLWVTVACGVVMLLTLGCITLFYIVVAFRKVFIRGFTPNALRDANFDEDESIGSASAQLNAIQATFDKT